MSIAQLKRDANSGKFSAVMVERFGDPNIPEKLQGKRRMKKANTVSVTFENADGKESLLYLPAASLLEYDGKTLAVYQPGYREPTQEEKKTLDEWEKISSTDEYRRQMEYDCLSDGNTCYWKREKFFSDRNAKYLIGGSYYYKQRGMLLDPARRYNGDPKYIRDDRVRGERSLLYDVYCD